MKYYEHLCHSMRDKNRYVARKTTVEDIMEK